MHRTILHTLLIFLFLIGFGAATTEEPTEEEIRSYGHLFAQPVAQKANKQLCKLINSISDAQEREAFVRRLAFVFAYNIFNSDERVNVALAFKYAQHTDSQEKMLKQVGFLIRADMPGRIAADIYSLLSKLESPQHFDEVLITTKAFMEQYALYGHANALLQLFWAASHKYHLYSMFEYFCPKIDGEIKSGKLLLDDKCAVMRRISELVNGGDARPY